MRGNSREGIKHNMRLAESGVVCTRWSSDFQNRRRYFFVGVGPQCGVVTFFSPPQCLIQESDFKIFGVSLCFPQDVFQF